MKKLSIICLLGISLYITSCQSEGSPSYQPISAKSAEEIKAELKRKEQQEFYKYIKANTSMRRNIIGEIVLEGDISNSATISSFKDAVLEFTFISKTGTVIDIQNHTVYEILNPNKSVRFKIKTIASKEAKGFSFKIVGATPI